MKHVQLEILDDGLGRLIIDQQHTVMIMADDINALTAFVSIVEYVTERLQRLEDRIAELEKKQ